MYPDGSRHINDEDDTMALAWAVSIVEKIVDAGGSSSHHFVNLFGASLAKQQQLPQQFDTFNGVLEALSRCREFQMLSDAPDILQAEMTALVWAMMWSLAFAGSTPVTIYSDCLTAISYLHGLASP